MKDVLMFVLPNCPHCKLALRLQNELLEKDPSLSDIPLRIVDESVEKEFSNAYDYYYVPTWYVGGEKVFEGHAEREDVERIWKSAAEGSVMVDKG